MNARRRVWGTVRRTALEILGWILIPVGIAALFLPGPGLLMIFAGVACLSVNHRWARNILHDVERRAKLAARESVKTIPRILVGVSGGIALTVCGIVWWRGLEIPEFSVWFLDFGPDLPFQGWPTGLLMLVSAVVAWVLIAYSYVHYRHLELD